MKKQLKTPKQAARDVIDDVLDADYLAEANPNEIPPRKAATTEKSENGVSKLKKFVKKKKLKKNIK